MEINGEDYNKSDPKNVESDNVEEGEGEGEATSSILKSTLLLENVGEAVLTLNSDGLSLELLDSSCNDESTCLGIKPIQRVANEIKFSDVYGVEFLTFGLIHGSNHSKALKIFRNGSHPDSEMLQMYRFSVHSFQRSPSQPCLWVLAVHTFGHKDLQTCQTWVDRINASLNLEVGRPKNLLVLVHPKSGKGTGCRTWEMVAPIFSRSKVKTKVIVTQRAGHAFDVMASTANEGLKSYDGVIAVGGDGFFNEIRNGFLLFRHRAPYPPSPPGFIRPYGSNGNGSVCDPNEKVNETSQTEDHSPLLSNSVDDGIRLPDSRMCYKYILTRTEDGPYNTDQDFEFPLPSECFRFGIIPAGSTDAIVMCTTGARDPITSALHIVLGKRVCLDVAQVVRWKTTATSDIEPCVRYASSFAGYGFYGDVITESEKYRWMGPKRYDYAGTKVFLRHSSYEAEVAYIETESGKTDSAVGRGQLFSRLRTMKSSNRSERVVCRINCRVCNTKPDVSKMSPHAMPYSSPAETRWQRRKGKFLSVGAAIISNRNERAPDGLVADAHLSDGFLHLLLIRDCPHALYLWHLTQLAKRGGQPLVEHHKTSAFTFTSFGKKSVWNLDGELFPAHQLSAQVFGGLVSLFASGHEI